MIETADIDSGHFFLTPGQLKTFTQALVHALYDRTIEDNREVRYYYDADIVVKMVLGLYSYDDIHIKRDHREDLVRALLSAGFLGKVHILRSHALELLSSVSSEEASTRNRQVGDDRSFRDRIVEYFGETTDLMRRLEHLNQRLKVARDDQDRLNEFLAKIKASGPEDFIAYELARGNWQERLSTLHANVLQFEHFGEDIEKILDEYPEVWPLNDAIAQARYTEAS